jgi:hypothetical protein
MYVRLQLHWAWAFCKACDCWNGIQVSVVHICEATLKKRLVEFEQTESGSLTVRGSCESFMIPGMKL